MSMDLRHKQLREQASYLLPPLGYKFHSTLRFEFEASNNEAEYEALFAGIRMTTELKAKAIHCYSHSQLVINQVRGEYQSRGRGWLPI